jgi:hypothetical protein
MDTKKMSKDERALWEYYRRAYKAATPSADFDELVENAKIVNGKKEIDYMSYELEEEIQEQIAKDIFKEFRIHKYRRDAFNMEFHLGCGPKTKLKPKEGGV